MNYVITTTEGEALQHHGILGQKWGVVNGPPYPLDAKDHNANEIKEGYKKSLSGGRNEELYERNRKEERRKKKEENKQKRTDALKQYYMDQGQTEEQAVKSAEAYKKIMKGLAIAGATAVLAGGAIYAYSKLDKYGKDFIIKKGQSIYRVASQDSDKLHDVFYATPDKMDFLQYKYQWGMGFDWNIGGWKYKAGKTFLANKDLKIASDKTARQLFNELLLNPNFSKEAEKIVNTNKHLRPGNNVYEVFNTFAPIQRGEDAKAFQMFKQYLQDKGYDGLIDFNDKYGAGLQTHAPIIFFGGNSNFALNKIENLNQNLMDNALNEWKRLKEKEDSIENLLSQTSDISLKSSAYMLGVAGLQAVYLEAIKSTYDNKDKE